MCSWITSQNGDLSLFQLKMSIDQKIHGISTLIRTTCSECQSQGTGFFYQELAPKDTDKNDGWRAIKNTWLVTNRHVIIQIHNGKELIPDSVTFHMRRIVNNQPVWDPIELQRNILVERALFHPDKSIDVCIIDIYGLLKEKLNDGNQYMAWFAVSKENLPGENKIHPEVTSDAIVIGYPRGFYDQHNIFPIVKSGIVASKWGAFFDQKPYFLIDAKLFPGSSGSIVISKPTNLLVENGNLFHNTEKQFAFLGVYSGEPYQQHHPIEFEDIAIIRKSGFNVGIVWYGHLVEDIPHSTMKCNTG